MFYLDVGPLRVHEGLVDERALAPNLVVFRVELAAAVADLERKKINFKLLCSHLHENKEMVDTNLLLLQFQNKFGCSLHYDGAISDRVLRLLE